MNSFSDNLRLALQRKNMAGSQLADILGVRASTVSMWLTGKNKPRLNTVERISEILDVDIKELIGYKDCATFDTKKILDRVSVTTKSEQITAKDERDIKKDLDNIMEKITTGTDGPLFFDGEEMSPESLELFQDELKIALRRLKLINKEKYNPHKNADRPPAEPPANEGQPPAGADPRQGNAQDNNQDNE